MNDSSLQQFLHNQASQEAKVKKSTYFAIVVDRSGSMNEIKDDMSGGIRAFVDSQKNLDNLGDSVITITEFDHHFNIVCRKTAIARCPEYILVPRGQTALFDAIGKTIGIVTDDINAMKKSDKPDDVLVVVVTDGYENASKEFKSRAEIKSMVTEKENGDGWHFLFLGADIDAFSEASSLGMSDGKTRAFKSNSESAQSVYEDAIRGITTYRCASASGIDSDELKKHKFFDDESNSDKHSHF